MAILLLHAGVLSMSQSAAIAPIGLESIKITFKTELSKKFTYN